MDTGYLIVINNPPLTDEDVVDRFRAWMSNGKTHDHLLLMYNTANRFMPRGEAYKKVINDVYGARARQVAEAGMLAAFLLDPLPLIH